MTNNNTPIILPHCYLPPLSWFALFVQNENIQIEIHEHFIKQTYRNRCYIATPNGMSHLVIPLLGSTDKVPVKNIRIANNIRWQKQHWKSLESSYRKSPYFEFYEEYFLPFYQNTFEYLHEFNTGLLKTVLTLLRIEKEIRFTEEYNAVFPGTIDYRQVISPKKKSFQSPVFNIEPYTQVFENKTGFIPDLSITDLLFSQGPGAKEYLEGMKLHPAVHS